MNDLTSGPMVQVVRYKKKAYNMLHPGDSSWMCEESDYDIVGSMFQVRKPSWVRARDSMY